MNTLVNSPIGIFDSGVGGLTVAKALVSQLPHENIIYFGDTAHLPYGDKSASTIQGYAELITKFLILKGCKLILIACNSASAAAYDFLQDQFGHMLPIINVIDPTADFAAVHYSERKIGLIGTRLTVNSEIYAKKILVKSPSVSFTALATPLFVPVIEEGFIDHPIIDELIREYLSQKALENIHALILGCTHYPLIKHRIKKFYENNMDIIDSSELAAIAVKNQLKRMNTLQPPQEYKPQRQFYVSDLTPSFAKQTELFFGKNISLQLISTAQVEEAV